MLKNYFKLAYRSLLKNKVASLVNILGLAVAVGCAIVTYFFVSEVMSPEILHEHGDEIFQVQTILDTEGERTYQGYTPVAMGPAIEADHPQVIRSVRIQEARLPVLHDDNRFYDFVRFVDPEYLSMFTLPLTQGKPDALQDPDAIVISQDIAVKYFGDAPAIGQSLTFETQHGALRSYTIRAVADRFAIGSLANFSILMAFDQFETVVAPNEERPIPDSWSHTTRATFVQLQRASDTKTIEPLLAAYTDIHQVHLSETEHVQGYRLDNLNHLAFSAGEVDSSIGSHIPMAPVIILSTITLFLFLLSCFNYINISLGAASARVKEIGIRKVIGSQRPQLIAQFLTENVLLCVLALLTGILFASAFLLPAFNEISGNQFVLDLTGRPDLWLFLGGLLLCTALASGAYPAFYVASFRPVAIFTGTFKTGGPGRFMKSLLTLQFVIALITMTISVGFTLNVSYLTELDWGYDTSNTLVVRLSPESYGLMHDTAVQLSQVEHVAGAVNHVGMWYGNRVQVEAGDREGQAVPFIVAENYFDVFRPRIVSGTYPTLPSQVLINQTMADYLPAADPAGTTLSIEETEYEIAGIVEDFHYENFSDPIGGAFFRFGDPSEFQYLVMRLHPGSEEEVIEALAAVWNDAFPGSGLNHYFQDETFNSFFAEGQGISNIFIFTALLALLLSCAGLFGLAAQHTQSKMKEMSIRKILGASILQIVQLGNRQFLLLLLLAALVATPIAYFMLNAILDSFVAYRMAVGPAPFAIAATLLILVASGTISSQIYRLVTINPAELLRDE